MSNNPQDQVLELRLLAKTVGISPEEEAFMRDCAEIQPRISKIPAPMIVSADPIALRTTAALEKYLNS